MSVTTGYAATDRASRATPAPDRETTVRRRSSGRTLVLAGAVLAVALMLAVPVRSWLSQRADIDRLATDIGQAQGRVDALSAQKQRWEDPRYVSAQARLRLNMVKPGESALIALDRNDERQAEIEESATTSWYEKLWDTTRSAAAPDQPPGVDGHDGG